MDYDRDHFLMSNLSSKTTGIDGAVIWVAAGEFGGAGSKHGPRIEVVLGDTLACEGLRDAVAVTLTEPPEVLGDLPGKVREQVVKFVDKNRDVLLRHWNGELSTVEMLDLLESSEEV
jgi:hypothetical protein